MLKIIELLKSPHIQIALATGFCIVIMAYFSKHVLPRQIGLLPMAFPPFVATIFESFLGKYKDSRFLKTRYWIIAVLVTTLIVILFHI